MEDCKALIAGNFKKICGYKPKSGIKKKWYGNVDDIDKEATVLANKGNKVQTLILKAGKKIYSVGGNDKSHGLRAAGVVGDYGNGFTHTDVVNILYRGLSERERIQEVVDGARIFSIIEKVDGGENGELTYEIAGFESGMLMNAFDYDSSANSGVATLTVASKEGEEEGTAPKVFLDTDVATTAAWLETNTAAEGDSEAPTTPTNLTSPAQTANTVDLAWDASTDNVGVTGYKVYKDGALVLTTAQTTAQVTGLVASTSYDFTVSAIDAAGNESAPTAALTQVTTA